MRWSHLFIPTLRDDPAEAEVASHRLLLRAGYIRQLAAGIYSFLPLAQRSINKINLIIRQEMEAIGAQEFYLPGLQPAELWQESGRWEVMGDNMFRLRDRFDRELCLGMTHEENMTAIARGELRSYKQLPQIWYQIQTKFRDEPRPRHGLLRVRQFLMKDSYSFDLDAAGLDIAYQKHYDAYCRIFSRCGLDYLAVEAHSGAMGGSQSHEFMVICQAGEDYVAVTEGGYAANLEKAASLPSPPTAPDPEGELSPEPFHTPSVKTIEEVSEFTRLPSSSQIKSLVMVAGGKPVLALLRGDHQLSDTKFADAVGGGEPRQAHAEEIRDWFGAGVGSLGPVSAPKGVRIVADLALQGRRNMICGANRDDYHLRHVTPGVDIEAEFADIRAVAEGDTTPQGDRISLKKAVEVGHIFKLGYKYSEPMGLRVLDQNGKEVTPIMGSYGIGVARILTTAAELFHDADGLSLPPAIAPFEVAVTPVNTKDETQRTTAERLYSDLKSAGVDVVLDDREERAGVKFKDCDLVGIPFRVTVGKKAVDQIVEVTTRRSRETSEMAVGEVTEFLAARLK